MTTPAHDVRRSSAGAEGDSPLTEKRDEGQALQGGPAGGSRKAIVAAAVLTMSGGALLSAVSLFLPFAMFSRFATFITPTGLDFFLEGPGGPCNLMPPMDFRGAAALSSFYCGCGLLISSAAWLWCRPLRLVLGSMLPAAAACFLWAYHPHMLRGGFMWCCGLTVFTVGCWLLHFSRSHKPEPAAGAARDRR